MTNGTKITEQLRNRREMVNHGNGNVTDEPDDICEEAANEIDRLRAEVLQCSVELGEAAKLIQKHYPRTGSLFEEACGRARVAIGLTPCEPSPAT